MNFLAHAYLSFNHPPLLVGNMISDFVKGKRQYGYADDIQQGIQLHREIDTFTDTHEAIAEAKAFFQPHYRLYSAPLVDILLDYFVANDEELFAEGELLPFTLQVYQTLDEHAAVLPPVFMEVLGYMKAENWLYNYRTPEGIAKSFRGLARRSSFMKEGDTAAEIFSTHQHQLKQCYQQFFPAVKQMAKARVQQFLA